MRAVLAVSLALIAVAPAKAQDVDQFDFVCTASSRTTLVRTDGSTAPGTPMEPSEQRFAVDLKRGLWCHLSVCAADGPRPIASADERVIVFEDGNVSSRMHVRGVLDRARMAYAERRETVGMSPGLIIETTGACRLEAFTAFPLKQQ